MLAVTVSFASGPKNCGVRYIEVSLIVNVRSQRREGEGRRGKENERKKEARRTREEEWRLRQCGGGSREVGSNWEKIKKCEVKSLGRSEMRLKGERLAYLVTVTWLADVHGLWVGDGPHAVSIVAIDSS